MNNSGIRFRMPLFLFNGINWRVSDNCKGKIKLVKQLLLCYDGYVNKICLDDEYISNGGFIIDYKS